MAKTKRKPTFKTQAAENTDQEAMRIAKATQAPGQSKEQTKLIAKGIAKGIAQYKKQQKSKQRDRERIQRKSKRQALTNDSPKASPDSAIQVHSKSSTSRLPVRVAATLFGLIGIAHLVRFASNTVIVIDAFNVPVLWSIPAAAVCFMLSVWLFRHR